MSAVLKRFRFGVLLTAVLSGLLLASAAGAGQASHRSTLRAKASNTLVIGISSRTWTSPPLKDAGLAAVAEGKRLGHIKVVFALTDDGPGQVPAVESLIAKKVNVIAIDPNDDKAIIPAVQEANAAGIPVIMWVGGVTHGKIASTIVTSEVKGGNLIANWVFTKLGGKGNVALEQGSAEHPAGRAREQGFRQALANYPGIKLADYGEGQWVRDTGETTAANFLTRTPNLDAIVALNDEMALGALTAAQNAGKKLIITGYNGECAAIQSTWQNGLTALLYQPFAQMGQVIVDESVKLMKHQAVPNTVILPEIVLDKPLMQKITSGKVRATIGLQTSVKNAINGCK